MGICSSCKSEITLKDNEMLCPECGEYPYICWYCKEPINHEKSYGHSIDECPMCHFFVCPSCGMCGSDCKLNDYVESFNGKYGKLFGLKLMQIRAIVEHLFTLKNNKDRKECSRGVPISYAKDKLKYMSYRLKGIIKKSETDKIAYESRIEKLTENPIGYTWTINKERDDGSHGYELRECSNLLICLGSAKKEHKIEKNQVGTIIREYDIYTRIDEEFCDKCDWDNIKLNVSCSKCKTILSGNKYDNKPCPNGCIYTKGKNKNKSVLLARTKSQVNFCQKPRCEFKKKGEI